MEFKQLEIKPEGTWIKRTINTPHFKRTLISIIIGAIAGFGYFYLSEGQHMESLIASDIVKSLLVGGFFGFFITNSPCARGRC